MTENAKPKKKLGCFKIGLIVIGSFIGLMFLFAIIGGSSDDKSETTTTSEVSLTKDSIALAEEKKIKKEQEKKNQEIVESLKNKFKIKKDEFESVSWVTPKSAPTYRNENGFYCYFSQAENGYASNFRFVGQYYADDWLFIKNIKFNIDGDVIEYYPNDVKRDNEGGMIWEWYDNSVDTSDLRLIEKIANAKSVKIRLDGRQYYEDKTMSKNSIKAIKETLEYYKALGGEFYNR